MLGTAKAYDPPPGIPNPATAFGYEIDRATPAWPASWTAGTPSATVNYYYVAPDEIGATNTSNTYGYPGKARKNLPNTSALPAGAFIWIKGGTYTYAGTGMPSPGVWQLYNPGTSATPLWICGDPANMPNFQNTMDIGGYLAASHVIIENINFNSGGKVLIRPRGGSGRTHKAEHIIIRDCIMTGLGLTTGDNNAVSAGGGGTGYYTRDFDTENMVVFRCNISNYGKWDSGTQNDFCGVYQSERSRGMWVLENEIFHVGGDAVAGAANATAIHKTEDYWVGRNVLYECGENNIDMKGVNRVVISQNLMSGPHGSQQGGAAIFHAGGPGWLCNNVWVIYNHFYHVSAGVYYGGSRKNPIVRAVSAVADGGAGTSILTVADTVDMRVGTGTLTLSGMSVGAYDGVRDVVAILSATKVQITMAYAATATGTVDPADCPYQTNGGVVGNLFRDIHGSIGAQQDHNTGYAATIGATTGPHYFVDNTCFDYEIGVVASSQAGSKLFAQGNIFRLKTSPTNTGKSNYNDEIVINNSLAARLDYNHFDTGASWFYMNADRDLAYMQGAGLESGATTGDPLFVDPAKLDFRLQSGSLAKDTGSTGTTTSISAASSGGAGLTSLTVGSTTGMEAGDWLRLRSMSVGAYAGCYKVSSVTDSTHVVVTRPYSATSTGTIDISPAYNAFEGTFGLDIRNVDRTGAGRPVGLRDKGAYEFGATGGVGMPLVRPSVSPVPPSGLRIIPKK